MIYLHTKPDIILVLSPHRARYYTWTISTQSRKLYLKCLHTEPDINIEKSQHRAGYYTVLLQSKHRAGYYVYGYCTYDISTQIRIILDSYLHTESDIIKQLSSHRARCYTVLYFIYLHSEADIIQQLSANSYKQYIIL